MAAPARNNASSNPGTTPANDNASSLRGANLRLIQGQGSKPGRANPNQPTLHPLSDMALARDLQESQTRDRMQGGNVQGNATVSDDTLKAGGDLGDGGSVLDLEPRSYTNANREKNDAEKESSRQRKLAQTGARFLSPGAAPSAQGSQPNAEKPAFSRRSGGSSGVGGSEQANQAGYAQGFLSEQRRDMATMARMMAGEGTPQDAMEAFGKYREGMRLTQLIMKLVEVGSVVMIIWVVIALNIETLNIILFRKKASPTMNKALNLIGLNIDVDPNHVWTSMNIAVVMLTVVINMLTVLLIVVVLLLILFITYWIMQAMDVLCVWGLAC